MGTMKIRNIQALKTALQTFKENPEAIIPTGLWDDPTWTREDFYRWFWRCLNEKINRQDTRQFRTMRPDYLISLRRDASRLRDIARRVRVYQFETQLCRERFGHLLARHDD